MSATPDDPPTFQKHQYAFTAYIRDPHNAPVPTDVDTRRMDIYRELFYNNIESILRDNFPVIHSLYGETEWHTIVSDFFHIHRCRTPFFSQIAVEFINYLRDERNTENDPPYLLELAHYEWVELAISIADIEPDWHTDNHNGDLLHGTPILSPLAWPLAYRFPVHRISPSFRPQTTEGDVHHLLIYRDRHDKVGFIELNPVSARLLTLITDQPDATGSTLLSQIADEIGHADPSQVINSGLELMNELCARDVLLGARST